MDWNIKDLVLFDSTVDEFLEADFFNKVSNKPNIALVGLTTDAFVFGGFYSVAVREQNQEVGDRYMFVFSLESHGRCTTPQRCVVNKWLRDEARVGIDQSNLDHRFVWFGVCTA